ncbi:MAG: amidohydrolase [Pyrodictiaceae archaeon]
MKNVFALTNAKIYVSFSPPRVEKALVVYNGEVIYVGSNDKAERIAKLLEGRIRDLEGAIVLPGFIDAHMHVYGLGLYLSSLDLRGVKSIAELRDKLKAYYERNKGRSWILGRGWDQELFAEKRWPTRWDIDDIVPDKPVYLERICGHAGLLNTYALKMLGLLDSPPHNPNFVRDERGELTGLVLEDAADYVRSQIEFREEELEELVYNALAYTASHGVTTVGFVSCSPRILKVLERVRRKRRLPLRLRIYLTLDSLDYLEALGLQRGFGDDYLKIMGVKLFVDGTLGARTARLSRPYNDDPSTRGVLVLDESKLKKYVERIHRLGLQAAIHAIGDEAVDIVLKAYNMLGEDAGKARHRIEHASVVRPEQIKLMASLGIPIVVQPHFVITDWWVINRLGEERASWIYPFKTMVKAGVRIAFSTDAPVEPINPWETIYAAITRGAHEEVRLAELTPHEKLKVSEALEAYTRGSAYALFEDGRLGCLEPGCLADLVIVDKDPLSIEPAEIREIRVLETIVGGRTVYSSDS